MVAVVTRGHMLKVESVNVGRPRAVEREGKVVETGIFKTPVDGPVAVRALNLDGDGQADLSVHGGPTRAVYAYPAAHYALWRAELGDSGLAWGAFGENLTVSGLHEDQVKIGDRFRIGAVELAVTSPRVPCYKLNLRFDRPDMVKRMLKTRRTGFYLAVATEGVVAAGDAVTRSHVEDAGITIADLVALYAGRDDQVLLRRASELTLLSPEWREFAASRLASHETQP